MSRVLYAAPVTSNVIAEMPTTTVWRREVQYCSTQICSYSNVLLFVPSGRIRAITQGEVERKKIVSCAELFCSELFGQSYITVHTL